MSSSAYSKTETYPPHRFSKRGPRFYLGKAKVTGEGKRQAMSRHSFPRRHRVQDRRRSTVSLPFVFQHFFIRGFYVRTDTQECLSARYRYRHTHPCVGTRYHKRQTGRRSCQGDDICRTVRVVGRKSEGSSEGAPVRRHELPTSFVLALTPPDDDHTSLRTCVQETRSWGLPLRIGKG